MMCASVISQPNNVHACMYMYMHACTCTSLPDTCMCHARPSTGNEVTEAMPRAQPKGENSYVLLCWLKWLPEGCVIRVISSFCHVRCS